MPNWTKNQEFAINEDNKNIIVSAGAGSGKTTVLTARVIRKLKSGVDINNLLILTFTKKAAFEMKDRIREAISNDETLINQLDYIDSSYITTFDSFSLSMVKKYSYLLNIGKNVNIADSSIIYLEKKRIIDDIFERLYKENNELFFKLLDSFTIKKDDEIKKYILDINDKLDLKYDKIDYLNNYINNYYNEENIEKLVDDYTNLLLSQIDNIKKLITDLSYYVDSSYINNLTELLSPLINSSYFDSIKNNLEIKLPQLPRNSGEDATDIKENITDVLKHLKELTRFDSLSELKEDLFLTKDYVKIIIEIIKELDEKLYSFKKELNVYEFADIAKMAIKILEENENVRLELKKSFDEIMIDEYQDTSDLQERFVSLIENSNVYMVGDIKQSIYRFRNANPYLFKNKYEKYSKNINGFKIDLTDNFRSRREVVDNINLIFSLIMTSNLGGADYKESHKMLFGNSIYENEGLTKHNNNFEIYNYQYDKDCPFSKEEIEIFFIAQDIKKKVENNYQIFDKNLKKLRNVNYDDFAILLDKSTYFDLYKKIFQYFNIPVTKYSTTNITLESEIVLIKNILKLIINRYENNYDILFKYAFTSVARSYLFSYDDQKIFDILSSNNYESDLLDIVDSITCDIEFLSLNDIIYKIIDKFDFYQKFILVGDVKNRINRISSIIDIFDSLANLSYTITDAYNYLEELISDQYSLEVKELDDVSNSVKLMTIHASKGLEFSICYFASFHSKFNIRDLNEKFLYNENYGIISPYFKEGIGKTFVKDLVKDSYLKEEVSEKIRLFYVALTRVKEKFIIVTSFKEKQISDISKVRSFLDILSFIKSSIEPYIIDLDINSLNLTGDYNLIKKSNYKESIETTKDKISIKEINIDNSYIHKEKISKENKIILDRSTKDKMKFGTYLHSVLELIDFKNPDLDSIDIDNYYKEKILLFLNSIDIENVVNIYKEYEFAYMKDNNIFHGIVDLILEYEDHIKIVDYKLKDVNDSNYEKQLNSYKDYLMTKTNKKIDIYLFSILSGTFKKLS